MTQTKQLLRGVIYDPPMPEFPFLAVVFNLDGDVLAARAVPDVLTGEKLIAEIIAENDAKFRR